MEQPITDYVAFLTEAGRAVERLARLKEQEEQMRLEEKRLEKSLEAEKKAVADAVNLTVKKRLDEINSSYDQEIGKGQERLKRIRSKREKAKNQGMKERIAEDTSELRAHNRELNDQMKAVFQRDRVPWICYTKLYYALYFTKGFSEVLIFLATMLVCFLAIPCGTYLVIKSPGPVWLVGIYFATIILFGGAYVIINNRTKVRHLKALKQGRAIRDVMRSNCRKIRVITSSIKKDRDEAVYDLEKYDDDLAKTEQELADLAAKKREALNTFETVTKNILTDEITNSSKDKIERMKVQVREMLAGLRELETQIKEASLAITDRYESYVGREFLNSKKLEELAEIIRTGRAGNISEAVAVYKNSAD